MSKIVTVESLALGPANRALEHAVLCLQYERLGVTDLLIDSILTPNDIASIWPTDDTDPSNHLMCLLICAIFALSIVGSDILNYPTWLLNDR